MSAFGSAATLAIFSLAATALYAVATAGGLLSWRTSWDLYRAIVGVMVTIALAYVDVVMIIAWRVYG